MNLVLALVAKQQQRRQQQQAAVSSRIRILHPPEAPIHSVCSCVVLNLQSDCCNSKKPSASQAGCNAKNTFACLRFSSRTWHAAGPKRQQHQLQQKQQQKPAQLSSSMNLLASQLEYESTVLQRTRLESWRKRSSSNSSAASRVSGALFRPLLELAKLGGGPRV